MASYILPICLFVVVLTIISAAPPDEKPFDCKTDEYYLKCDLEVCLKTCEELKSPPPCPSIHPSCYSPACLCANGNLRNSEGKCVPAEQC
ncbi:venom peptide BmKAPI-like [Spodoptera litura]|uniref:Venom peptide BmKAPI-like n=1 Tax=Spodoptera litura TaxID=69820 RepID=A0A9J7IUG3_SPOLT|nr:venom peptide BmKAPI-like [Spodoptera litura]